MTIDIKNILIFGSVGTEVVVDSRRYELVVLSQDGTAQWRGKCESCWATIFVETSGGKPPAIRRCNAHRVKNNHPAMAPMPEEPRVLRRAATMPLTELLPPPADRQPTNLAADAGMKIVGSMVENIQRSNDIRPPGEARIFGNVTMHMGDAEETTVSGDIPRSESQIEAVDPYSPVAMLAELADLAPEGGENYMPPPPALDQVWGPRIELFMKKKMWLSPEWGPRPNEAGCQAPEDILVAFGIRS